MTASPIPALPRIAGVAMIRNECDIIELFLSINLRELDYIYLLDHQSDDGTRAIIEALQRDCPNISYTFWPDKEFRQAAAITSAVREIAAKGIFDYIVPLDADEFLVSTTAGRSVRQELAANLPPDRFGLVPWQTFCPVSANYFGASAPLHDVFRPRRVENPQFYKIVLGNEFARNCSIGEGNHIAGHETYKAPPQVLPLVLQHAPVRSPEQIIRKAVLGQHTLLLKPARGQSEGTHWDDMAAQIRERGFHLDDATLTRLALGYAASANFAENAVDQTAPGIGLPTDVLLYPDLARPNVLAHFDAYISQLVDRLRDRPAGQP